MYVLYNVLNLTVRQYLRFRGSLLSLSTLTSKGQLPTDYTRKPLSKMAEVVNQQNVLFKGRSDPYDGITVLSEKENCKIEDFPSTLEESLKQWNLAKRRAIWFKVGVNHSGWVPILVKNGFKFHHAKEDFVMMYKWLPTDESCNLPHYAHTTVGVGGIVVNDKNEILVVSEKYYKISHWKLPGGYVDPGENLVDAAIREIYEETKIMTEFETVVSLRHAHNFMFGCSDLYAIVALKPLTKEIEKLDREIAECRWLDLDEYLNHSNIHELNKLFVRKYLDYKKRNIRIDCVHGVHELLKKAYTVYHVDCQL